MIEVPSAAMIADVLAQEVDFFSIGTNDLIQYLFAADRRGSDTAGHARFETDAVLWDLIRTLSRTAAHAGKPISICGELAGNPSLIGRIMQSGVTAISISPAHIARVRQAALKRASDNHSR